MTKKDLLKKSLNDIGTAPAVPAPMQDFPGMQQAYDAPMPVAQDRGAIPMRLDPQAEQQAVAAGSEVPMNPMISELAKRFGLLGMLRNRSNVVMKDPYDVEQ